MPNKHNEISEDRVKGVLVGRKIVLVSGGRHGLTITLDDGHVFEIYAAEAHHILVLKFEYRDKVGTPPH